MLKQMYNIKLKRINLTKNNFENFDNKLENSLNNVLLALLVEILQKEIS